MALQAKVELVIKFSEYPPEVATVTNGWKEFKVENGGRSFVITVKPGVFKKLEDAKAPPAIATWEEVAAAFDSEMEKVTKSGMDPAAALKAVQVKADSIGTGG